MASAASSAAATGGAGVAASGVATARVQGIAARLNAALAAEDPTMTTLTSRIQGMKEEQARVKEERKQLSKELRNAQKRKRRLKSKARQLSNDDLLAVLQLRSESSMASDGASAGSESVAVETSGLNAATPACNSDDRL